LTPPHSENWQVQISQSGRGGTIEYQEEGCTIRFDWEFGGSVLAIIFPPSSWPSSLLSRRREIIERVGAEAVRQKAPNSRAEIDDDGTIHIV
jgi:hypothetical protein